MTKAKKNILSKMMIGFEYPGHNVKFMGLDK